MKMDALNFLKKKDKKKSKKTVKKPITTQTTLQQVVDFSNPWAVFNVVDKNVFTYVIDDFVKKAKWRRQKTIKNKNEQSDLKIQIDLDTIDLQNFGKNMDDILWNSTTRDEKEEDIQTSEILAQIDVENISMFYNLRMFIPWYTAIHFLREYADDNQGLLAPELYIFYLDTPEIKKLKSETHQFLQQRIAKTAGITNKELNNPAFTQIFSDFYKDTNNKQSAYIFPPPRVKTVQTIINKKKTVVGGKYEPLILERKHVHFTDNNAVDTTWLYDYGIKGFVVSNKNNVFATSIEIKYNNITWYKVNKLFYKQLYTDKRSFVPGLIGYIMQDSSVVTETLTMFERLKLLFEKKESESRIKTGYKVAIDMINQDILLNSVYSVKDLKSFAAKIVESFKPCDSVKEIAKKLSFVLVYYRKLITGEQSYIENTKKKLYAPENLLNLQKDILLPEVYSLSAVNKKEVEVSVGKLITQIRKEIETSFFIQLQSTKLPEEGRIYLRAKTPFARKHNNQLVPGEKFAPGLIQKLKTLITFVPITTCSFCNKHVYNLSYKSIYSGEVQDFCNQECFEKFEFKNEKNV
jgi:hypothetical protein